MENNDFKINTKTVWVLVIGNNFLIFLGAIAKIQHWEFSEYLLTSGIMVFFSSWIIIFSDMLKNKIYHKVFWIMSMFIIPFITSILYLLQKDKLIRLGSKLGQ